jgi:GPI-anchor transamidase subunit T
LIVGGNNFYFSLHTYLQSVDQQGGKIATRIHNLDETPRKALFTHMIPWYLRIYLHTLAFVCNGARQEILNQRFSLAIDRQKPILIEFEILLPPNSICEITYDYEAAFLRQLLFFR